MVGGAALQVGTAYCQIACRRVQRDHIFGVKASSRAGGRAPACRRDERHVGAAPPLRRGLGESDTLRLATS